MSKFEYKAVRIRQTETGDYLVLFAAPATQIDLWVGIPQKKQLADQGETTGFQREENPTRIKELKKFYQNEKNIIQNPLLCARRGSKVGTVTFELAEQTTENEYIEHGIISIDVEPLENKSLLELLELVKEHLESRVESLKTSQVPDQLLYRLKARAKVQADETDEQDEDDETADPEIENVESAADEVAAVFSDESHILDFWIEIAARAAILKDLGDSFTNSEFEGFSKDAMISFLRPIVLVDGQHRLRGAISAAQELAKSDANKTEIENRIIKKEEPTVIQRDIETRISRKLPISLLMSEDPAEQVFQFVVVNQKAVPIGKALLGTIVSTSLSNDEIQRVSQRLGDAGIELDESRVVAYLTRSADSPFYNLVEKGLASDNKDLLPWSVLRSLATIFQNLRGGRLFHSKIDYAAKWEREYLEDSSIISDWSAKGYERAFDYWSSADGPWRDVFVAFWTAVRDRLADASDDGAKNHWGAARNSQIFNKISLTILAADFFQFLCDRAKNISDAEAIPEIVDEWLSGVAQNYFSRDWSLSGVKKDSTGIRNRWSKLWVEYRKDPIRLPALAEYRKPSMAD